MKYSIISKYRSQLMALSMILILLFHSWDLSTKFNIINEIKELGYLGVDVFLFLSGLGISISLSKKKQSFKEYYKKRLKRILPVTYLIIIPYTIYLICTKDVPLSTLFWNATFLYYFVKPIGAFNWFAAGILIFYAFAPLWHKFITKENQNM